MSSLKVYLDNNATTFVDPLVCQEMIHFLEKVGGNPSSIHSYGREAKKYLTSSRETIASYLGVRPQEIIFTSGATEAMNTLLGSAKGHVITSNTEHACVFAPLQNHPNVTYLDAGEQGAVTAKQVEQAIRQDTSLIALIAVNNETGVKLDIEAVAEIAERRKIPFVVDAVAWMGKEQVRIPSGVTGMAFSGHKFHAPKGVGFYFLKRSQKLSPLILGGEQEFGKRGGTENLPGIVALAKAVELLDELPVEKIGALRDRLEKKIVNSLSGVYINGKGPRVCNVTNLAFEGVEGDVLLANLDLAGVAVSHGSACSSGGVEPSRVLISMGLSRQLARSSIRFSLSRFTTEEEIDFAGEKVVEIVKKRV